MEGLAEAIKYLYQQFILRDVVAYVTPGTILTACVLEVYLGSVTAVVVFIKDIPTIAYVPIYGFLFIIGLGIQNLGEMSMLLPEHNRKNDEQRFAILQEFHRAASAGQGTDEKKDYGDWLERTRERIEVKKYASGNIAAALAISAILIWLTKTFPYSTRWAVASVGAILLVSLKRAHDRQMRYVTTWEDEAIESHKWKEI